MECTTDPINKLLLKLSETLKYTFDRVAKKP